MTLFQPVSASVDPRPVLKLANFAVDPGTSGGGAADQPKLKLATFAVDPSNNSDFGTLG